MPCLFPGSGETLTEPRDDPVHGDAFRTGGEVERHAVSQDGRRQRDHVIERRRQPALPGGGLGQVSDQCECRRTGFYSDRVNATAVGKRGIQQMAKMENPLEKMGKSRRCGQRCRLSGISGI